jgi:hypothetical protein
MLKTVGSRRLVGETGRLWAGAGRPGALGRCGIRGGLLVLTLVLGSSLVGGCSDSLKCEPPIPDGAQFKVTLLGETTHSQACHVVDPTRFSPFVVTAAKTEPTIDHPDCSSVAAVSPPQQLDVTIESCTADDRYMLGIECNIEYKSACTGTIWFVFAAPDPTAVNWQAPVIDNVLFQIQDKPNNCLGGVSDCVDEYAVRLERMP